MFRFKVTMATRPVVRARACLHGGYNDDQMRDRMGIFQLHPHSAVSISEARSAYDVCHINSAVAPPGVNSATNPSYIVLGVNGEMVEKYIDIVESLEASYVKSVIANDPGIKFSIGPFTFFITKKSA